MTGQRGGRDKGLTERLGGVRAREWSRAEEPTQRARFTHHRALARLECVPSCTPVYQ